MNRDNSNKGYNIEKNWFRRIIIIMGVAVILLVIIYLAVCTYVAYSVTKVGPHPQYQYTPGDYGKDYEDVRFQARGDDIEIAAWYIPNKGSESVIIMVHGKDANKRDAISGNFPGLGAALHDAGNAVLMIDMRGHGNSEGERFSFGVYERRDVLGGVDWLLEEGFQPGKIAVLGLSMGGAAAIGATAEEPAVGLLVLESTFAELGPLVEDQWEKETGLPRFFLPGVNLMVRLLYGYDLFGVRPVEEFANIIPRPVMIIHCTQDEVVPLRQAEELLKAVPQAESWVVSGCEHAEIYCDHRQDYEERLTTFLRKYLK
jgi:pimeloyl-ACP methyl ester carboxylesterase